MQHYRTAEGLLPAIPVPGNASRSATSFSAPDPDLGLSPSRSYIDPQRAWLLMYTRPRCCWVRTPRCQVLRGRMPLLQCTEEQLER